MNSADLSNWLTPQIDGFYGMFREPLETPPVADGVAVLDLYGVVGWDFSAVDVRTVLRELSNQGATTIEVHLDSPGGNAAQGVSIFNSFRQHTATINVHVDGYAASAASVIAMAGNSVTMHPGSMMMVHYARATADALTADDCRAVADLLDKVNENMAGIYQTRAGGDHETWLEIMGAETWFTASEAVDAGLADVANPEPGTTSTDTGTDASVRDRYPVDALTEIFGYTFAGRDGAPPPPIDRLRGTPSTRPTQAGGGTTEGEPVAASPHPDPLAETIAAHERDARAAATVIAAMIPAPKSAGQAAHTEESTPCP